LKKVLQYHVEYGIIKSRKGIRKGRTKMTLQYQLGNGQWINCENENRVEQFIGWAINRQNKTREQIIEKLAAGEKVCFGSDWYNFIRDEDSIKTTVRPVAEMIKCACGHTVAKSTAMTTAHGTSCPDCYDRMSN
jgi:hypothetical protein